MQALNETHDPALRSWVDSANREGCDFPIQNLPLSVFRRSGTDEPFRGGVAIGDQILDLSAVDVAGIFEGLVAEAVSAGGKDSLNLFMAMGSAAWSGLRLALSRGLREGSGLRESLSACLVPQDEAEYGLPARIGDYTDFYTSIHHATNIGRLFRPDAPLLPNYQWIPIGYHGRASSVAVSGQAFRRPMGQIKPPTESSPVLGPCRRLDYELELGIFIGKDNPPGDRIEMDEAENHVFGLCILNDWSARDIQAWEYQPLGPFLAKSFASTISPWIVTLEALAPYRAAWERPADHPQPLPYLDSESHRVGGAMDIRLQVLLQTRAMSDAGDGPTPLSRSNFRDSYWSVAQMVTHHAVNGCNLCPGDLFGSGTQSGPQSGEEGSLIELTGGGKRALTLPNGETRTFLEDGDTVVMRAWCEKPGVVRIGFGEVVGTVLPAGA